MKLKQALKVIALGFCPILICGQAMAARQVSGTFIFDITITTQQTGSIDCVAIATVPDATSTVLGPQGSSELEEEAASTVQISGGRASCELTIPYSWTILESANKKVLLSYNLGARNRFSEQAIALIPIPADGTTTTETIDATL